MIIEDAMGTTDDRLAIFPRLPRKTDTRRDVVVVLRNSLDDAQRSLSRGGAGRVCRKDRRELYVIAHAVIQRELRSDAPGVLNERSERLVAEIQVGISHTLHEYLR